MRTLAIIPARGGSKRLPLKNIMLFCGKPLVAWTIEQALEVGFDQITLTSDSLNILDVGMKYGINCVPRDAHLATDTATLNDVVLAEIERFPHFDRVVLLQPTSPLRTVADIKCGLALGYSISVKPTGAPNGAVYVVDTLFFKQHPYFGGQVFYMPKERSVDIDTIEDFRLAESYGTPK